MSYLASFDETYEPDGQEYYRVESWYKTPWGDNVAPEWVVLGWADNEVDKIRFKLRDPNEDGAVIIGSKDDPPLSQVWKRETLPRIWSNDYISEMAQTQFKHLPEKTRKDWWKESATEDMQEYATKQWQMRWDGVFVWINGRLTWLTGTYWAWLQWVKLDGEYPTYLDVQLRLSYVVEWSFQNKANYGIVWLKRRRIGGSYFFMWAFLDNAMKYKNYFVGLQGNTEAEIQKDFERKMVPMWQNMPLFFRTENDGTDNPKTGFRFKLPAKGGHKKFEGTGGNESYVETAATNVKGKEVFDREKMHGWYRDEWAKAKVNVYNSYLEIKRTMESMGKIIGRALMPSTAGEASNANVKIAEELFFDSLPSSKGDDGRSGRSVSGLRAYFTPAYDSLFIEDISFIGPWGEGVIGKPTKDQFDFLIANQPENRDHFERGGSWVYVRREYALLNDRAKEAFKRQYPSTPRDAFKPAAGTAHINPAKVGDIRDRLLASTMNVKYHEKLTIRCRIEPEGLSPTETGNPALILRKNMRLVPDPSGLWLVRHDFYQSMNREWAANKVMRQYDAALGKYTVSIVPDGQRFSIGVDPIDKDKDALSTSRDLSNMSITAFWKYDANIDEGKAAGQTRTYSPVMHFLHRLNQKEMYLELCKAVILLGSKAHIENTRASMCFEWMREFGLSEMILRRPINTFSQTARLSGRKLDRVEGTPASDDLYHMGIHDYVNDWVTTWASPENCPFMDIWNNFKDVDPKDMQPYDSFVSFMFAYFDAAGGGVSSAEKNLYLSGMDSKPENVSSWSPRGHSPNKYRIRN